MVTARVHFGIAAAGTLPATPHFRRALTIALVDDGGRLLDLRDTDDDVHGYGQLLALLARYPTSAGIATDADGVVTDLLCAAGRHLAITDIGSAEAYGQHFIDGESVNERAAGSVGRRAVGLAHALRTGVLVPVAQPVPSHLRGLEHALAAHAAALEGRDGAASALHEMLRQLYPAVLRAFPDPAATVPLAILAALPDLQLLLEPSGEADRWIRQLIADVSEDVGADPDTVARAMDAFEEVLRHTPPYIGQARLTRSPARAVQQAAAAVRAHDEAVSALLDALAASLPHPIVPRQRDARADASWQVDDQLPVEPPVLRPVEPPPFADRPTSTTGDESDDELLIFQEIRSAWFARSAQDSADAPAGWTGPADEGWRAAQRAAQPSYAGETAMGLPRRAPMTNLVPGSAAGSGDDPATIRRSAASVAAHAANYFRGWRRDVTGDRAAERRSP